MATDQTELYSLLEQIANEDKSAFSRFYDLTINRAFAVIMRITHRKELAEEVASDVYMQVWRTAANYNADIAAPMTWLVMIARSRAIDTLRRECSAIKNQYPLSDEFDAPDIESAGPLMQVIGEEKKVKMWDLLSALSAVERQMIVLAFYKGMSHTEIAAYTGKPLGSVKTVLRRAQLILKSALNKAYFLLPISHECV